MRLIYLSAAIVVLLIGCKQESVDLSFSNILIESPSIKGNEEYIGSPYVTAGDRVYMVGHQDGTFPEIGWHVKGEMGGIWLHPIKLMDGFEISLSSEGEPISMEKANSFVNYPAANTHYYKNEEFNIALERTQFAPDTKEGLLVQFTLTNNSDTSQNIEFKLTGHTDLMPVWLGERTQMVDGKDISHFDTENNVWLAKDELNPWYAVFGLDMPVADYSEEKNTFLGKGVSNSLTSQMNLSAGESKSVLLVIAGSMNSESAAIETFNDLKENNRQYLADKVNRMESLSKLSKLTIPDKELEETFEWLKYNCDWLIRDVPGIGTAISAGIPDYPWWFGVDSEYSLKGYMAIGQTKIVYNTIHLLDSVSNAVNGNGRIIHEMSTNGAVFNEGNINETPQFASLIWETYLWNGELEFLKKYFPTIKKGLHWLMSEYDTNKNLFPDGFGMMEIHGLDSEMIDVAAYTQRAFQDASKIATELGELDIAAEYSSIATKLKTKINDEFWSEDFGSFADFIGTDEQTLHLIEDAIVRADTLNKPWAIEEMEETRNFIKKNPASYPRPFVLHHNWVVNTPMEMKIADKDKALKALETAENFVNPFGVFVTGIDRDESAGSDDGSFSGSKVFSYTGAVMTLPTGVQAIAENNYGRPDKALDYLKRMTRSFSYALPGSMYEVSPDYGMMTQAWNIYSFAIPIVHQFFGISPIASEKKVRIRPMMPVEWTNASLENVVIADNEVSVYFRNSDNGEIVLEVLQTNSEWTLEIVWPESESSSIEILEGNASLIVEEGANPVYKSSDQKLVLGISTK